MIELRLVGAFFSTFLTVYGALCFASLRLDIALDAPQLTIAAVIAAARLVYALWKLLDVPYGLHDSWGDP